MNKNLTTSKAGIALIIRWEGCVLKEYICPAGKPTIGVGHVVLKGEKFPPKITREFAEQLLAKDLKQFEAAVYRNITVPLTQNQFDALVCFTFNVGPGGIGNTGVQRAVNSSDFGAVPAALEQWSKAKVDGAIVTLPGLLARRKSEGELFNRG